MKTKKYDYTYTVGRGNSTILSEYKDSFAGLVYTKYGIVEIYVQGTNDGISKASLLRIIKDGIVYCRNFTNKKYSKRGIVTKAKQFAEEVFKNV